MSVSHEVGDVCSSPIAERAERYEGAAVNAGEKYVYPRPADYDSWTDCKKQSWDQLQVNPNAFFYRHVLPNEKRKNGPWSEEEKMLFIAALRKQPVENTHWGLFARNIPGRVGYQCNAFYKKLVASGELQQLAPDINITLPPPKAVDENGKPVIRKRKLHVMVGGVEVLEYRDTFANDALLETVDIEPIVLKDCKQYKSFGASLRNRNSQLGKCLSNLYF